MADVRRLVGVGGVAYAGSHGAELLEPGSTTPRVAPAFKSWEKQVKGFVAERDTPELRSMRVRIEDKGPIMTFHWRGAPDEDRARTHLEGLAQEAETAGLAIHWGRKVLEIRPPVPVDKGQAVRDLVLRSGVRAALFGGDDVTDLDGFAALTALADEGELDHARARGRALGRGSARDPRAGRSGGGRDRGLPAGAGGAGRGVRFRDFLRVSVLLYGGAATALAVVSVVGATRADTNTLVYVAAVWWCVAALVGLWLGRRPATTEGIARLLADARSTNSLPQLEPGAVMFNRLWPLAVGSVLAGAIGFFFPQLPVVATGFFLLVALLWRSQSSAVAAIEGRDGVEFWFDRTSPLGAPKLLRLPGLRRVGERGRLQHRSPGG